MRVLYGFWFEKLNWKEFWEDGRKLNMDYLLDIKESLFTSLYVSYRYFSIPYMLKKHKNVFIGEIIWWTRFSTKYYRKNMCVLGDGILISWKLDNRLIGWQIGSEQVWRYILCLWPKSSSLYSKDQNIYSIKMSYFRTHMARNCSGVQRHDKQE